MNKTGQQGINISFLANPLFIFAFACVIAMITYSWDWSRLYPELSGNTIIFLLVASFIFLIISYLYERYKYPKTSVPNVSIGLNDLAFVIILLIGIINVVYMGYIPLFDKSHNYREFGAPVIDVLFNTLSVFFSLVFLQSYLDTKKIRMALYIIIFLIIQVFLFRRSTVVWIVCSSIFLIILHVKRIKWYMIITGLILIPVISFAFGFFGNQRSSLTREMAINNLGMSQGFQNTGLSHNHYLTYLYISSPLANLQENISDTDRYKGEGDLKDFLFYCIIPPSLTMRLEEKLQLAPPENKLIAPELIVGTCFMNSYRTLGWIGMMIQVLFILLYSALILVILNRWNTFYYVTLSLMTTSMGLLIFDNILIRLDIIIMLFIYPVFFHFVNRNFLLKSGLMKSAE